MGNECQPAGTSQRNEDVLEEARAEPIAMVMIRRMVEWFGYVNRSDETEIIRAVVEIKMAGTRVGCYGDTLLEGTQRQGH